MAAAKANQSPASDALISGFQSLVSRTLEICELLEALADELPKRPMALWREARRQCRKALKEHAAYGTLQTAKLMKQCQHKEWQRDILFQFEQEYCALAFLGEDLDSLFADALSNERNCIGSEALGYALRCHSDALRKHTEWEKAVLFPTAKRIAETDGRTAKPSRCIQ